MTDQVQKWANEWGNRFGAQPLSGLVLDGGFFAISEPVHNHEYPLPSLKTSMDATFTKEGGEE